MPARTLRHFLGMSNEESVRLEESARPCYPLPNADVAQLVEHVLGKDEVSGSIPDVGSRIKLNGFSEAEMRAARSAA